MRQRLGFTLTEMLVTAAILAILAGVAIPLVKVSIQRDKETELRRSLRLVRDAIDSYKKMADEKKIDVEEGDEADGYPPTLEVLVEGVKLKSEPTGRGKDEGDTGGGEEKIIKFLRRVPVDPMTGTKDWGLRSNQDAPDAANWGGENVFDIYTKSRRTALDGSKYADW
ncbi:MAG: type II secretion system protein [Candidatus Aminicenantes bacterium]|nr:type II secretion system protein [Candidatus Aminicenantes bacterium]